MSLTSATRRLAISIAVAGALLAGCASSATTGSTTTTTTQPPGHHGSVTISCTSFTAAGANCAKTVTIAAGSSLHLVLSSTYWQVHPVGAGAAIAATGAPVVRPEAGCVAGAGCGTVEVTYTAVRPGTVTVLATRRSCGEALGCTPATGRFALHVQVRPA